MFPVDWQVKSCFYNTFFKPEKNSYCSQELVDTWISFNVLGWLVLCLELISVLPKVNHCKFKEQKQETYKALMKV